MITITNETPSENDYPVSFGGDITLQKVDTSYSDYKFEVTGLRDYAFTFWIPKTDAGGSTVDYEAVMYWLMLQVNTAAGGTNSKAHSNTIVFTLDSVVSGVATLDVSGYYNCVFNGESDGVFNLTIEGIGANAFDVDVDVNDAGGNSSWPDPGDVFRWLMEKLKELVCPNCL